MNFTQSYYKKRVGALNYINRYFSLSASEEMQGMKLFPNIKEITEAFAIFSSIERYVLQDEDIKKDNDNVQIWVIGDGKTPRCAGLINFLTKWHTISIDPLRSEKSWESKIKRLQSFTCKVEDVDWTSQLQVDYQHTIIVLPHSHVEDIKPFYDEVCKFREKVWLINNPCCYPHQDKYLNMSCIRYNDNLCISDKNEIRVYCNYMTPKFI